MNSAYGKFLELPEGARVDIFNTVAEELNTLGSYVEKDYWVCLTLELLFHGLPENHPSLYFKGGTSLSKVFNLIDRFSEDIDISVSRSGLGFTGDRDPTSENLSTNKRNRLVAELKERVSNYVREQLRPDLQNQAHVIGADVKIEIDPEDADNATLLLYYPKLASEGSPAYVQPRVKVELGARSAQEPHNEHSIEPFIARAGLEFNLQVGGVRTIVAERTFWEKVLILHGLRCGFEDEDRQIKDQDRASRHYYDVAMITKSGVCDRALEDHDLLQDVRKLSLRMYRQAWRKIDTAISGCFRITPRGSLGEELERDYSAMQGMILGQAPTFEAILRRLENLETRLNTTSATA